MEYYHPGVAASGRGCLKAFFRRDRRSKPGWKSRFYAKSTSADGPVNFRLHVDAHTSILAKCFYTLWAESRRSRKEAIGQERTVPTGKLNLRPFRTGCSLLACETCDLIKVTRPLEALVLQSSCYRIRSGEA